MKKYLSLIAFLLTGFMAISLSSCGDDDDDDNVDANVNVNGDGINLKQDYDVLQINGESFACYGYRCIVTYSSIWDLSEHDGDICLPCGKLSDAQKGEYDYDYLYRITLDGGNRDLKTGCKLEDFAPALSCPDLGNYDIEDWGDYEYASGSAVVTDKKDDEYVTIKFSNFKFAKGDRSYTFNGTVQLDFDED